MLARAKWLPFCLALVALGCSRSTAYWVEQAKSDDPARRLQAVHTLRERVNDGQAVIPALVTRLTDDNSYVRRDAARSLGHFGPGAQEAVPALLVCRRDKEPSVRKAATEALLRIDPSALPKGKAR